MNKIIKKIKNLEGIDKFTLGVLVFGTLYIGGHLLWFFFRHEIISCALAGLWAAVKICHLF